MTDNIRRLFKQMDYTTKEEALACIKKEFNVENRRFVKKEWILGGRIPQAFQEKIVNLFQNLSRKQAIITER